MGTSACGGPVKTREGKGKAQLRRPAASRPRRDYSGPPPPSAQKLKSRRAGCLRCPIIGASREKHRSSSPREGKAGFSALTRFRAITPNKWKPTGASTCRFARAPYLRGRPETEPKRNASVAIRQGAGNCPGPYRVLCRHTIVHRRVFMHRHVIDHHRVTMHRHDIAHRRVAVYKRFGTSASSHIGTSPAPPSGYTPMVPIRSSSDAVSIHQTPELSCVNVSSTWRSAASASRVTSRKIWPPCL